MAFCGMAAVACSSQRERELAPPIGGASPDASVTWGRASQVPGTEVMRIDLVRERSGLSSGGYAEVRNILFLDPAEKAGHWLLPDSRHYFTEELELNTDPDDPKSKRMLGTVALLKEVGADPHTATGKLLIFDPPGRTLQWLADGVRELNAASVAPSGDFVILYERNRQFVIAVVDGKMFKLTREQIFDIPILK